jgi:ArsR family transcriptional regulator, arsenate/arsenite/antimonite-responsive transcriptional repressor
MNESEYNHMKVVEILSLINVLKALSDETRMRILNILKDGDLCVCEIEVLLDINQSNASRHLIKLTHAKILDYYKVTKYVYYKINKDTLSEYDFLKSIIEKQTLKLDQCVIDNERLKKYKDSGLSCDDLKEGKVCFEPLK